MSTRPAGKGKTIAGRLEKVLGGIFEEKRIPLKITLLYLLMGIAWTFYLSDIFHASEKMKDLYFLSGTTLLIYGLINHAVKTIRRSEGALKESEQRLTGILETNPCGVVLLDKDEVIAYANPAASGILGVKRSEMIGRSYREIGWEITQADGNPFPEEEHPGNRVLREERNFYDVECAVRLPGRKPVILSFNSAPLRDAGGGRPGTVVAFIDITERRKAQALNLRKLSLAVEQSPIAIMITDPQGRIEYVNAQYTRMTGYSREEVLGTRIAAAGDRSPESFAQVCGSLSTKSEWKREERSTRKNGDRYWEKISVTPIRNEEGEITHFLWVREDITEHRKADESVRESEERFRELFEQTEEPILLFASDSARILDANPAAVSLYGHRREDLIAGGPSLFVEPCDAEAFGKSIAGILKNGIFSLDKACHRRKNGARIIVSIRGKSIRLKGGRVSYCTIRDITDRVRMEEEGKAQQAKLIHSNRMTTLGMIVSGVAHEVSNPNNLIMFNVPLLQSAWQDALPILERDHRENGGSLLGGIPFDEMCSIVPKLLMDISESSRRIKGIVGMLKDFARQDKARRDELVDLNEVVRTAVAILRHEITKGTRNFRVEYGEGLPMVMGWAMELEQVVINLIVNSLQALPDASRGIMIVTSLNGETGCVEIRVRDEGTGMSRETMARLTEPFFSTKLDTGGLGLGLSISHTIVKEHKGRLVFESEVGKGTIARIALPALADMENGKPGESRPHATYG